MNNLIFKNSTLNIVVGVVLIVFTILAYFLEWYVNAIAIIIGIILILLSTKRFVYTYKGVVSKKATLILAIEYLIDIIFAALLIFVWNDYVAVLIGVIIYTRGLTYLIINYVVKRKVILYQYILNILLITLGSFLLFTGIDLASYFIYFFAGFVLLIGIIYLLTGIFDYKAKKKPRPVAAKTTPEATTNPKPTPVPAPKPKPEPVVDYTKMTVVELQFIAKQRGLTGVTQLNKADLIKELNKKK